MLVGASRACAIDCEIAAVHESLVGTKLPFQDVRYPVATEVNRTSSEWPNSVEIAHSRPKCRSLNRHCAAIGGFSERQRH